jgi:hypothetical protein
MSSGIAVGDDVVDVYLNFKMKKNQKYVAFKISDDLKMIEVEGVGGTYEGPYSEFEDVCKGVEAKGGCRYYVVYFHYETDSGQSRTKILFVSYTSENAKTKEKMLYTSSKSPLKMKLEGADLEIQANDLDDVSLTEVTEQIKRKSKD